MIPMCLADGIFPDMPERDKLLIGTTILFMGILFLGAVFMHWADRWKRRQLDDEGTSQDEVTSFRAMYERGELSREEYDRILSRVSRRMRSELDLPAKDGETPPSPAPSGATTPTPPGGTPGTDETIR